MRKLFALTSLALALSSTPALAADPSVARHGSVNTSATFCEGVRLDRTMTYSQWLHEYALDLFSQSKITDPSELLQKKFAAYKFQSKYVKQGQYHLCPNGISQNWVD